MAKPPTIYKKGEPLGALQVKCETTFRAAADLSEQHHGLKGRRIYTAAEDLMRGIHHLTSDHALDLASALKAATGAVKDHHGLNAPALRQVQDVVCAQMQQGDQVSSILLGRQPE